MFPRRFPKRTRCTSKRRILFLNHDKEVKIPYTNEGRRQAILRIGSSSQDFISYFAIGSGSGVAAVGNKTLVAEVAKFAITGSPDFTTNQKVTFTGDRNAIQMSGIQLREFGLYTSGAAVTGSIWAREGFAAVTFDTTNELRLEYTIEAT